MCTVWAVISCLDKKYLSTFYGSERIIRAGLLFQQSWRKTEGTGVTTALVINRRRHLCVYLSLSALLFSPSWLTCNYPSRPPKKTFLDRAIIQIQPQSSHHVEISDREDRDTDEGGKCLFCRFSRIIDRQVMVVACLSPFGRLSDFIVSVIIDRATCWPTSGDEVVAEEEAAELRLCVGGPRERGWRQTREWRALTHYYTRASDSHGVRMTQASHTHARTHTFAHGYTNTCVSVHRHICSFYLSHGHMCVCTLVQNKAGCLLFTGCGNRFASMPSLSHEGWGIQKEM